MEEKEKKYAELLKDTPFKVMSIHSVNHKPHPYMIGPSHVSWASDHWSGMLSEEAIRDGEKNGDCRCYQQVGSKHAHSRCNLPYDEHTSNLVLFLQLKSNVKQADAQEYLKPLVEPMKEDKIDGFTFVETNEKYRIK